MGSSRGDFTSQALFRGLLLITIAGQGLAGSVCEVEGDNKCACRLETGERLDLSNANPSPDRFYETAYFQEDAGSMVTRTYYFHPCKDSSINTSNANNTCKASTICTRKIEFNSTKNTVIDFGHQTIGNSNGMKIMKQNDGSLMITSQSVDKTINTVIFLECRKHKESYLVSGNNDPFNPVLIFYSPHACLSEVTSQQHSLGTTLLIIFFVMVLTYIIMGVCVKHFLMGARGIEVIPNVNFWRDLPELLKDGITFVRNGFKPPVQNQASTPGTNPTPTNYDSI